MFASVRLHVNIEHISLILQDVNKTLVCLKTHTAHFIVFTGSAKLLEEADNFPT